MTGFLARLIVCGKQMEKYVRFHFGLSWWRASNEWTILSSRSTIQIEIEEGQKTTRHDDNENASLWIPSFNKIFKTFSMRYYIIIKKSDMLFSKLRLN